MKIYLYVPVYCIHMYTLSQFAELIKFSETVRTNQCGPTESHYCMEECQHFDKLFPLI